MYIVRNIRKTFDGVEVLKGVTLEIEPNQTTVLIGPSGSGKTTLLRCINLLELPDSGEVELNGSSCRFGDRQGKRKKIDAPCLREIRRKTGMVFQNFQLFPHKTAVQNIMEGPAQVLREDREQCKREAMELLVKVGLSDRADAYPYELSGGNSSGLLLPEPLP